ncbi:MAG: Dabb family protein [Fidelibacterota bacterium]|nr:MAG: Dabb family protein [Candidatus Neomarinimicrobiota bacterium]
MIKHIVMWRLNNDVNEREKEERAIAMQARLESLPQSIPQIRQMEIGLNINPSERAMDILLYSEFASRDDLNTYSGHLAHQEVVTFIRSITSEVRVVDYEA